MVWVPCSHELLCRPDGTGQWSQTQLLIYFVQQNSQKEQYKGATVVQSESKTWLNCFGGTIRDLHRNCLQTSTNWSNVGNKSGPTFIHNHVRNWTSSTENQEVLQARSSLDPLFPHSYCTLFLFNQKPNYVYSLKENHLKIRSSPCPEI